MNEQILPPEESKRGSYKTVCAKLGFIMCVFYICRIISVFVMELISRLVAAGEISINAAYISQGIVQTMLLYLTPILVAAILFRSFDYYGGKIGELYKKPERLAKKLGTFPAVYGLAYGVALITIFTRYIISRFSNESAARVAEIFEPTTIEPSSNIAYIIVMSISLVVFAPIFEEILCRGIMYDALKPYGDGAAIIITSVLFGLMHGTMYMLFYTTAVGFALGYVRYATNSLFVVTVLHALINGVQAVLLISTSLGEATNWENRVINTFYNVYQFALIVFVFVGIAAFLKKIPVIKKYRIENAWNEISGKKKVALFFLSVPTLIMLVFAFNQHANNLLLDKIIEIVG